MICIPSRFWALCALTNGLSITVEALRHLGFGLTKTWNKKNIHICHLQIVFSIYLSVHSSVQVSSIWAPTALVENVNLFLTLKAYLASWANFLENLEERIVQIFKWWIKRKENVRTGYSDAFHLKNLHSLWFHQNHFCLTNSPLAYSLRSYHLTPWDNYTCSMVKHRTVFCTYICIINKLSVNTTSCIVTQ